MPELALIFTIGAFVSLIVSLIFRYNQLSRYKSKSYRQLQENLAQISFRWSDLNGRLEKIDEVTPASPRVDYDLKEIERVKRTYFIFSFFAFIFSWVGLIFGVLIWFSVNKLARNRTEKFLFASPLVKSRVPAGQVTELRELMKSLGFD